ncbi:hypothetical protein ACFX12_041369 [Malus domestica]
MSQRAKVLCLKKVLPTTKDYLHLIQVHIMEVLLIKGILRALTVLMVLIIILEVSGASIIIEDALGAETITVPIFDSLEITAPRFLDLLDLTSPLVLNMAMVYQPVRYVIKEVTLLLIAFRGILPQLGHLSFFNVKFAGNLAILHCSAITGLTSHIKADHHLPP